VPKGKKQVRIGTIRKEIDNLKGQVIDVDFIKKRWPKSNPYKVLMELQNHADVIIVHHSMLATNKKIRKTDFLIVDDADLMNRDQIFSIAKFKAYHDHLQATGEHTDFKEIRDKIKNIGNDKIPLLKGLVDVVSLFVPDNPEVLESAFISDLQDRMDSNNNPLLQAVDKLMMEDKTSDEILNELTSRKHSMIKIGIEQASNPLKLQALTDELTKIIKIDIDGIQDKVDYEISYAVSMHIHDRTEGFFNALLDAKFDVKEGKADGDFRPVEINLSKGSDFMEVVNSYQKVIWISATADPDDPKFKGFKVVQSKIDPHADHKIIREISRDELPDLLSELKNHNVFVVVKSNPKEGRNEAEEFQKEYGGDIVTKESYDAVTNKARNEKGVLAIGYVNGYGSRGLDDLADLFDAVIIVSWIYRSNNEENGEFYGENQMKRNLADVNQIIGRIMRSAKDHILYLIKDETKLGSKLAEYIRTENPTWKFYNDEEVDFSGLISKIPERVQKETGRTILRKSVQKLKNGKFSLSYITTIESGESDRFPNTLEL
jgi:hypothetical protein